MGFTRTLVILTCVFLIFSCADAWKRKSGRSKRNRLTCRAGSLVRYQMTVKTLWDKKTFPKMFPTYRPPAHWSQLIGRSHGSNYRMWQDGANASFAVQRFAEDEEAEHFHLELSQGYNDVLDAFVAPDIEQSVGETSAVFSVDGSHPKSLPKIAQVEFVIISEYRLRKVHKEIEARKDNGSRAANAKQESAQKHAVSEVDGDNVISKNIAASSFSQERPVSDSKTKIDLTMASVTGRSVNKMRSLSLSNHRSRTRPGQNGSVQPQINPAPALEESGKQKKNPKDTTDKVDCQVSEWTEWSPCSQTCGFGNKSRSRGALVLPRNGGGHCPLLKQESICGSMRNCKWKHFSLMGGKKSSPFGKTPKRRRRIRRRRKHLN